MIQGNVHYKSAFIGMTIEWTYVATPEKIRIPIIPHVVNTPINDDNDKYRRGTKLSGRTLDISSCSLISDDVERGHLR